MSSVALKLFAYPPIACLNVCIIKHLVPSTFHHYFCYNKNIHGHSTRTTNNLHMMTPNTTFEKRCTKYKCTVLWIDLPDFLKVYCTVKNLKTHSKNIYFQFVDNHTYIFPYILKSGKTN